jgi:pectate lyase
MKIGVEMTAMRIVSLLALACVAAGCNNATHGGGKPDSSTPDDDDNDGFTSDADGEGDHGDADPEAAETGGDGLDGDCPGDDPFCLPPCAEGAIGSRCACGESEHDNGYCCSNVWQATPCPPAAPLAFPGAQGSGARTVGGRGGDVYEVVNLNDSGEGSLRACVDAEGPRTCVFRVGGTIELASRLSVWHPYLTIAGQTAPGGGIALSGVGLTSAVFSIHTHDVVVRYFKSRKGFNEGSSDGSQSGHPLMFGAGACNVMVDHCSFTWTQDENYTIWSIGEPQHDITLSWSIIGEPLADHPTNTITGSDLKEVADELVDLDFHHNFLTNSSHRNPLLKNKRTRFVNNIVYNWKFYATQIGGGAQVDVVGNLYKHGWLITQDGYGAGHEIQVFPGGGSGTAHGPPSLYVVGNVGPRNADPAADNWTSMVAEVPQENGWPELGILSTLCRRDTPLSTPASGVDIEVEPVATLAMSLMPLVGASQRLTCDGSWTDARDAADSRMVAEYASGTGAYPEQETDPGFGGFPTLAPGTPCADGDHDGMPDTWETALGLDPADASDGPLVQEDGYTNLEHYLGGPM